jgi:hypothetical protein
MVSRRQASMPVERPPAGRLPAERPPAEQLPAGRPPVERPPAEPLPPGHLPAEPVTPRDPLETPAPAPAAARARASAPAPARVGRLTAARPLAVTGSPPRPHAARWRIRPRTPTSRCHLAATRGRTMTTAVRLRAATPEGTTARLRAATPVVSTIPAAASRPGRPGRLSVEGPTSPTSRPVDRHRPRLRRTRRPRPILRLPPPPRPRPPRLLRPRRRWIRLPLRPSPPRRLRRRRSPRPTRLRRLRRPLRPPHRPRVASATKRTDTACISRSCCRERWCPPGTTSSRFGSDATACSSSDTA